MDTRSDYGGCALVAQACLARLVSFILPATTLLCLPLNMHAQDLEPRTYTNIPVGQNFAGVGYIYSDGEINPSPSVPLKDVEITMKTTLAAYVRSLDLWGTAGKVDASWGRSCIDGSGNFNGRTISGDRCGTLDPSVRVSYLFYGAPAMDMQQFRSNPSRRVIGASLKVDMPLGDYNNENLINTGSNRWTFKPEIGISNRWGSRVSVEASFSARLFTDNDNFFGDSTLEQKPLYQVQTHFIYDLDKGRWVSINGNYFWGGQTTQGWGKGRRHPEKLPYRHYPWLAFDPPALPQVFCQQGRHHQYRQ